MVRNPEYLNCKIGYTGTPLIVAARYGSPYLVERFIELGADVNATSESGENALHTGCLPEPGEQISK